MKSGTSSTPKKLLPVLIAALAVFSAVSLFPVASAHEEKSLKGYGLTFGMAKEPAYTFQRNQINLHITEGGDPVALEQTVSDNIVHSWNMDATVEGGIEKFEVTKKGEEGVKVEIPEKKIGGAYGRAGWYEAEILFTEPGTYEVHVHADIKGEEIHTHFEKEVKPMDAIAFPGEEAFPQAGGREPAASPHWSSWAGLILSVIALIGVGAVAARS